MLRIGDVVIKSLPSIILTIGWRRTTLERFQIGRKLDVDISWRFPKSVGYQDLGICRGSACQRGRATYEGVKCR